MFRPKKEKTQRVKLSKDSVRNAMGIFSYISPYKGIFILGWLFLVVSSFSGLAFPLLLGELIGSVGSGGGNDMQSVFENINLNNVNTVALALMGVFVVQAISGFIRIWTFTVVTENVLRDIREDAFSRLIHMPMDFFNQNNVGELTSRISSDIVQIQETLRTTIAEFFRQFVIIAGSLVFLFIISWKLSLIMLATVPVTAVVGVLFGRFIRKLSKKAQDETASSNRIVEESFMGISNVKSFTNELLMVGNYKKAIEVIRSLNVKSGIWRGIFASFIIVVVMGAIVFIIWQGVQMSQGPNPEFGSGGFVTFMLYTMLLGTSFASFPDLYASIQKSIGATENLMQTIKKENEADSHTGKDKPVITGEVAFSNVKFQYPQRVNILVLDDISMQSHKNQTIALVGASGAGKSTVASLLLQFYPVSEGKITFDGVDSRDIDLQYLRSHMALVPQEVILFSGSIRENILFGDINATEEELINAARKANALDFIESFPDKWETEVGDRGIQLSGGQKQRVAIARAILKNPRILILDEATSALDSESEKLVQSALDELMVGRTSFVIAHRLSTIKKADNILVFDQGKIVESGTHDELIDQKGVYANLVALQGVEQNS